MFLKSFIEKKKISKEFHKESSFSTNGDMLQQKKKKKEFSTYKTISYT